MGSNGTQPISLIHSPPNDCLQYFTGVSGRFTTFNFDAVRETHTADWRYSICVRQESGYCCNEYSPCPDMDNSFSINNNDRRFNIALQDSECTRDYVLIEGTNV